MPAIRRKRCKVCGRLPKKSMKGGDTQTNTLWTQLEQAEEEWRTKNAYYVQHADSWSPAQQKQYEKGLVRLRAKRIRLRDKLHRSQQSDVTSRADTDTEE